MRRSDGVIAAPQGHLPQAKPVYTAAATLGYTPTGLSAQLIPGARPPPLHEKSLRPQKTSAEFGAGNESRRVLWISTTPRHHPLVFKILKFKISSPFIWDHVVSRNLVRCSQENNQDTVASRVDSLGGAGLQKRSAAPLPEPAGNRRNPQPRVSWGATPKEAAIGQEETRRLYR